MRPPLYTRQLRKDLEDWIAQGLVPPESRAAILASVGAEMRGPSLAGVIAILGVILLSAGITAFIAANWNDLGRLPKLVVMFGALGLAYGIAAWLFARGWAVIAEAVVLLGVALYGLNLMLVGQIYHLPTDWAAGYFLWAIGALAAAVIVPSRPALIAAIVLGGLWTVHAREAANYDLLHLDYLVFAAATFALSAVWSWGLGLHASFLALILWLALGIGPTQDLLGWRDAEMATLYALGFFLVFLIGRLVEGPRDLFANGLQRYGLVIAGILVMVLSNVPMTGSTLAEGEPVALSPGFLVFAGAGGAAAALLTAVGFWRAQLTRLDLVAALASAGLILLYPVWLAGLQTPHAVLEVPYLTFALGFILWGITLGLRIGDRVITNLGFFGFGGWVLYVYYDVFGSYMDAAAFFTIGGVLLVLLAVTLEAVRRRVKGDAAQEAAA